MNESAASEEQPRDITLVVAVIVAISAFVGYVGETILLPLFLSSVSWWIASRFQALRHHQLTLLLAVQSGHGLWILLGVAATGLIGWNAVEVLVIVSCLAWLAVRPGRNPLLLVALYQCVGLTVIQYVNADVPLGSGHSKAVLTSIVWRVVVLFLVQQALAHSRLLHSARMPQCTRWLFWVLTLVIAGSASMASAFAVGAFYWLPVEALNPAAIVSSALVLHVFIVHSRERHMQARRPWRAWYVLIGALVSFVLVTGVAWVPQRSGGPVRDLAVLAYYWLFFLICAPALLSAGLARGSRGILHEVSSWAVAWWNSKLTSSRPSAVIPIVDQALRQPTLSKYGFKSPEQVMHRLTNEHEQLAQGIDTFLPDILSDFVATVGLLRDSAGSGVATFKRESSAVVGTEAPLSHWECHDQDYVYLRGDLTSEEGPQISHHLCIHCDSRYNVSESNLDRLRAVLQDAAIHSALNVRISVSGVW